MKREVLFPSEEPTTNNLDNLQNTKEQAITERLRDFQTPGVIRQPGLIINSGAPISIADSFAFTFHPGAGAPGDETLDIGFGIAYDMYGERIGIFANDPYDSAAPTYTPPQTTGNLGIPLTINTQNHFYVRYLSGTNVAQYTTDPDTGVKSYTSIFDSYIIVKSTGTRSADSYNNNPYYVYAGSIELDAAGGVVLHDGQAKYTDAVGLDGLGITYAKQNAETVNIKIPDLGTTIADIRPANYFRDTAVQDLSLQDHINAIGSEEPVAVNPHGTGIADINGLQTALDLNLESALNVNPVYQRESHQSCLISPALTALAMTVDGPHSAVIFTALTGDEVIYVYGKRYTVATPVVSEFSDPTIVQLNLTFVRDPALPDGLYAMYVKNATVSGQVVPQVTSALAATFMADPLIAQYLVLGIAQIAGGILSVPTDTRQFYPGVELTRRAIDYTVQEQAGLKDGHLWYDTALHTLKFWNGTTIKTVSYT